MKHLRTSINVTGQLSVQDFNAARQIIARAVTTGKINQESADKAERFLQQQASLKAFKRPVRDRILLATFYTLSWGLSAVAVGLSVYTRYFQR